MDMDTMIFEATENEYKNMQALLAKYQSDINDLKAGTGDARTMSQSEIWKAEEILEAKISKLVEEILSYEEKYCYIL